MMTTPDNIRTFNKIKLHGKQKCDFNNQAERDEGQRSWPLFTNFIHNTASDTLVSCVR